MVAAAMKQSGKNAGDGMDAIDKLSKFLGQSAQEDLTQNVVQHQTAPVTAQPDTKPPGTKPDAQPDLQTHLNRQLDATLNTTGPVWAATEKLNASNFADNAQSNRIEGQNKINDATGKMETLRETAKDLVHKGAQPNQDRSSGAVGGVAGLAGATLTEGIFAGLGMPGAGLAVTATAAVVKTVVTPNINIEGQGTYSSQKTAYEPASKGRGRMTETKYSAPEQQPSSAPQQQIANKLNNGPGFGRYDLLGDRSTLASQNLNGITEINFDKMLAKSPAMQQYKDQMADGMVVEKIHLSMQKNGLENEGGKQSVTQEVQALHKAPMTPTLYA